MYESGLDFSAPVGVSGLFLSDDARFLEIRNLLVELDRLNLRLNKTEYDLACCNDPKWLDAFRERCRRSNRDAKQDLVLHAAGLETEKRSLIEKIDQLKQKLLELEPSALQVHTSLAGARALCLPVPSDVTPTRVKDPNVASRNKAIDCLLHLRNFAICKELDDMFPPPHAPQLLDGWFRRFGVKSFVEAYRKCPRLVHAMIGRRRKLKSL